MMAAAATTSAAIANSGQDAIERPLDVTPLAIADDGEVSFEDAYEISHTAQRIAQGEFKRVGLQFPDELLHDSTRVFFALRERLDEDVQLYVLADTTYGSCCVDEVAAQHVDADLVVHYGHACLTPTARLPALYVLTKRGLDVEHAASELAAISSRPAATALLCDVAYAHALDDVAAALESELGTRPQVQRFPHEIIPPRTERAPHDDAAAREKTPGVVLYVGGESLRLTNLLLTHASSEVFAYDPATQTCTRQSGRTNRLLMRRYAAVEKAKDADVIGIVVGTLGVSSYLPLISQLRKLIAARHKKAYTLAVGKLNPAKLANFLEIECFVLVACPENSLIDSKEFLRPMVTPYELQLALRSESLATEYMLDFEQVLRAFGGKDDASGEREERDEEPVFSATTGKYRHAKRYEVDDSVQNAEDLAVKASALQLRNQSSAVAQVMGSAAGDFLAARTYRGLDPRYGESKPATVEAGQTGIARGYSSEGR